MVVTYRAAKINDANEVAEVYLTSRKTFLTYAPLVHSDEGIREWISNILIPAGRVSVAEGDSGIIGMMGLSESGGFGWIDHLYLKPSAVGLGVGSSFVDRAKSELGDVIRLYAFQENVKCCRFYERHGFKTVLLSDGSTNEEKCPDILYQFVRAHTEPKEDNKSE